MNLIAAEKNALNALDILLQLSKVRVTRQTLREKLGQHPDFPSLVAISDVLTELNVNNLAISLTIDRLADVPTPALAHLQIDGGLFAPVRKVTENHVEWLHTNKGWQLDNKIDFVQRWSGATLLIEPDEDSGEHDYEEKRRKERVTGLRLPFIIVALCVCLGIVLVNIESNLPFALNIGFYELLLIKVVGIIVSCSLVGYSINTQNGFLRRVCQLSSQSDCQTILNTSAAKLTDWLSWAEIGAFYFVSGFFAMLVYGSAVPPARFEALPSVLLLFTCISLVYTVWSVYYQARVARQWCVLCLAVQLLL